MDWRTGLGGLTAGLLISVATAPVGVSGARLRRPQPLRDADQSALQRRGQARSAVAVSEERRTARTTRPTSNPWVPGVVVGAVIRVFALPGPAVFRVLIAAPLLPLGVWLCTGTRTETPAGTSAFWRLP